MAHTYNLSTRRLRQEDGRFAVNLGYTKETLSQQTANSKKSFLATLNTDEPLYVRNFYAEASFMGKASWQALRL